MGENVLKERTETGMTLQRFVKELEGYKFYVPDYQRGYRWTDQEVKDFLDDIYLIDPSPRTKTSYCLQPLIVKAKDGNNKYEIVDGQQRLTTIFIVLKIAEEVTKTAPPFTLKFDTREKSELFLQDLGKNDNAIVEDNIDYYHVSKAFLAANNWIEKKCTDGTARFTVISNLFNVIREKVFFIWYSLTPNETAVDIFNRVNMGKIGLSNAELIKALIFSNDNFPSSSTQKQELAIKWDSIERKLQEDSFWYFLSPGGKRRMETRIDLIFDLLSENYNEKLPSEDKLPENENLPNRTFLIFYTAYRINSEVHSNDPKEQQIAANNSFITSLWQKVEGLFERFVEWFNDINKYHVIGYLIASGIRIERLFELSEGKRRSEVLFDLIKTTKEFVPSIDKESFASLVYGQHSKLKNLLLLGNIATLVCKNEKQYRFPFDIYKKEKWDIEHIHATADESADEDDSIGNLTLLSASINRSYQAEPFLEKRRIIIDRDSKGMFIPVCTKNVFLKAYSSNVEDMTIWGDSDKRDYLNAMWTVLSSFWKGDFE